MDDQRIALTKSNAGMRLIAQMRLYNEGDFERLHEYIETYYTPESLVIEPADRHIVSLKTARKLHGRMKVKDVRTAEKHHAVVVMETEKGGAQVIHEMKVGEDYPHAVLEYLMRVE